MTIQQELPCAQMISGAGTFKKEPRVQTLWFGHLIRIAFEHLTVEIHLIGKDYTSTSYLAWKSLGIPQEELQEVDPKSIGATLLPPGRGVSNQRKWTVD